eukprot:658909-Rhodomonas_salina.1
MAYGATRPPKMRPQRANCALSTTTAQVRMQYRDHHTVYVTKSTTCSGGAIRSRALGSRSQTLEAVSLRTASAPRGTVLRPETKPTPKTGSSCTGVNTVMVLSHAMQVPRACRGAVHGVPPRFLLPGIALCPSYAMPGTDTAHHHTHPLCAET